MYIRAETPIQPSRGLSLYPFVLHKKNSTSMQAHDAVASALLHRQHLITRTGVLLIQLVHGSPPRLATKTYTGQDPFLNIF